MSASYSAATTQPSSPIEKESRKKVGEEEGEEEGEEVDLELISHLAKVLKYIIKEGLSSFTNYATINRNFRIFNNPSVPEISIHDYLKRIGRYGEVSESTLILALIYVDRICQVNKIILTKYNVHRLFFTAFYLAIKYNEDDVFSLSFYASLAGVGEKELLKMEESFFLLIEGKLFVNQSEYDAYRTFLKNF